MNFANPASGPWTGFFNHQAGGPRYRMDLSLTFTGGIVTGQGNDCLGMFGIAGCYDMDGGEILLTKTYYRANRARFRGFIDGSAIWGTWEIKGTAKGGFHIWPWGEMVEHEVEERESRPATGVLVRKLRL